uniref:NADH-ubiquinone oxidoreductase chain 3 n=1 Tax=Draco maculatus TaxID=89026 RepID=A0A6F8C8M9_9SAUR|nr:NADH dehydrogenase subunit 3 [Draco maculatus]
MMMMTLLLMLAAVPLALVMITHWLPQTSPDQEKLSPYECGFAPLENARLPFSLQFFLVAISFLLFDLEIALLLPLPWAINLAPTSSIFWTFTILTLLTAGLAYEWNQGALNWTK